MTDTLKPYSPGLRERIAWALAGGAGKLGAGRYTQQDIANAARGLMDFIPGLGDAVTADEFATAIDNKDWIGSAINGAALAAGIVPIAGDFASKAIKSKGDDVARAARPKIADALEILKNGGTYKQARQQTGVPVETMREIGRLRLRRKTSANFNDPLMEATRTRPFRTKTAMAAKEQEYAQAMRKIEEEQLQRIMKEKKAVALEVGRIRSIDDVIDAAKKEKFDIRTSKSKDGGISSYYLKKEGTPQIRVSDHEIPWSSERDARAGGFHDGYNGPQILVTKPHSSTWPKRALALASRGRSVSGAVAGATAAGGAGMLASTDDASAQENGGNPMIEVELPDGTIAEFPEGTSPDVITSALRKRFGTPPNNAKPTFLGGVMQALEPLTPYGMAKDMHTLVTDPKAALAKADQGMRLGANALTFGMADRIASWLPGGGTVQEEVARTQAARDALGVRGTALEVAGNIVGPGKLAGMGVTATRAAPAIAKAVSAVPGLSRIASPIATGATSVADALAMNAAYNYGQGRDIGDNAGIAALAGAAAPMVASGVGKVVDLGKAAFNVGNKERAAAAMLTALDRSGKSIDDIAAEMNAAAASGQPFALADALGTPGQRMAAGVARLPGNARTQVAGFLDERQAGQGRRIAGQLDEAFGAPMTAAQTQTAQEALRRTTGNVNYGAARAAAGAVDTSAAIAALDDQLTPGVSRMIGTGVDDTSVYKELARVRRYLGGENSMASGFDTAFAAKMEMDKIIQGGGPAAALVYPARAALDDALAAASRPYANARDTYRAQSKALAAIETGRNAANRGRVADTVPAFEKLGDAERGAFRAGYVDPLIERAEGAAIGVNKARPLMSDATAVEFPAFAKPGMGRELMDRLSRENTMFETRAAALGGSKTADNLADMAELGGMDTSMIANILGGKWRNAAVAGMGKGADVLRGRNDATRRLLAEMLTTTGGKGSAAMRAALATGKGAADKKEALARALLYLSIPAMARSTEN